ncbi:hypothetical protein [Szabonella alba]|uniref:Major capsid protein n=1 Tax=Szabonella alba TaxID=2804194 RepID=A0A8K0Y0L6_9RHOB|nr:hypothetical protein [Szabonella alba]MBL4917253.1 hypothetical protein [Szabonella alba]
MARQSTTPVSFNRTVRPDECVLMSSGRAGKVQPVGYIPLFPGDSASGRCGIDIQLKEMPKPLLNGVFANVQAWFVPKSAFPQFAGRDELMHAMTGETIKALGAADRTPPGYFTYGSAGPGFGTHEFNRALGLHANNLETFNHDLHDAFTLVYNFRLAAHSSRLTRRPYYTEAAAEAMSLPRAFWPSSRLSNIVPDYERALVLGSFDLDVAAGSLELTGDLLRTVTVKPGAAGRVGSVRRKDTGAVAVDGPIHSVSGSMSVSGTPAIYYDPQGGLQVDMAGLMIENTGGAGIPVTLADIDKARTTQAFAKLRTAYAGNDATGFDNDDTIVALLMQGISVPQDQFKRPWLLDSKRVPVGFVERHATDGANLDASVTLGRASASLTLNVPQQDVGGMIIITVEVLPERIDERMTDEYLRCFRFDHLPNALRDVQRVEPVDLVQNRRIDSKHSTPAGLYGYEPMNYKWRRNFTRLGGDFYMDTPGGGWTENRSNIWQTELVNPTFSDSHYLAPADFPHEVFSDPEGDAFEVVYRHSVSIAGLTQMGDILAENNDDYEAVQEAGE